MTDVRWTGRRGEKTFSLLCSERMVTCNKSEEDDLGWDFILQFPSTSFAAIPIDERSNGPAAVVQIKATQVDAKRWSISLKNALSLTKSPLPAFIVCVGFRSDETQTKIFRAIHIWRADIERILKAARHAHSQGDEATNHRTISFELGDETERSDLIDWMISEINGIGENRYATAKQLLVDTLGYEEGRGIARIKLSTGSPEEFADLQLGLIESLDINEFSFTPRRFGIDGPTTKTESGRGKLEMIPAGRHGTLRLRAPGGAQEFIPATIFSAVLPGQRRLKGRIKAGCLDVIIKPMRCSVTCTLPPDERTSLENLTAFALLRQSSRVSPLAISLKTDGSFVDFGHINIHPGQEQGWQRVLAVIEALKSLVAFEKADPIEISLEDIQKSTNLAVLHALASNGSLRIEFTPLDEVDGEIGKFLAYATVELAGIEIGAVASRDVVRDEMIGERRRIDFGPAKILHASIGDRGENEMRELYLDEVDRISECTDVLAIGDLLTASSGDEDRELKVDMPRRTPLRKNAAVAPN